MRLIDAVYSLVLIILGVSSDNVTSHSPVIDNLVSNLLLYMMTYFHFVEYTNSDVICI